MSKKGMGKGKSILALLLSVAVIAVLAYTAAFGLRVGDYLFPSVLDEEYGIRQGLDLVGGSSITYEAQVEGDIDPVTLDESMNNVVALLRERLDKLGYAEATIVRSGDRRVTIEIPSVSDPEQAVQEIGSTAKVTFIDGDGNEFMDGTMIADARGAYGDPNNTGSTQWYIAVELTDEGAKLFGETTQKYLNEEGKNHIAIKMDDQTLLDANFDTVLNTKNIVITGNYDEESAKSTGALIAAGALPFELKDVELRSVGATLGDRSLETCLQAGGIGLLLVMLFMIVMYRLPGLLTSITLVGYVAVVGLILSAAKVNLSLPGIAGIILSIGMAVDANVVIFERIKEELHAGKSLKGSVQAGFSRAFSAILDANITTIIASAVLYQFGTGPIKGFAVTLFTGIVVSMFTAIIVTRFMLNIVVGLNIKNPALYCAPKREEKPKPFHFVQKRKIFAIISAVVIACGVVSMAVRGFNLGIDFAGGTTMQVNLHTDMSSDVQNRINSAVESAIGEKANAIQSTGEGQEAIIKTRELTTEERDAVFAALQEEFQLQDSDRLSTDNVTATVGKDLQRSAFLASALAVVLMLVYIAIRFELLTAISAVSCLVHDVLVVLSFYSIFGFTMNTTFIAAILTILGYSINATIVVFDRVRENKKLYSKEAFADVIDKSIWQTMGRSINTSLTTLLVIVVLFVVGVPSIREFALPIIIGICAGAYSSVFLAGNAWNLLEERSAKKKK
ncbi:MAG: protein translocase subunit SecD [Eubacteriales bacterium]|jgi:SecD/SecF fusion protein